MPKVWKMLKKAMIITMEDQISYCNRTIQVGPHLLVVTAATMDTSGECSDSQAGHEADRRLFLLFFIASKISVTPPRSSSTLATF